MRNRNDSNDNSAEIEKTKFSRALLMLNDAGLRSDEVDTETVKQIADLSERNQARLKALINNLQDMGLLSIETLKQALERVTLSIPQVDESPVVKIKNARRNEYQLGTTTFFMNHGASRHQDGAGGQANINKGYSSNTSTEPAVSVKRMNRGAEDYAQPALSLAKREARYLNFLGRQSTWYRSKKGPVIVGEWQPGESIREIIGIMGSNDYFYNFTLAKRLRWLTSGFEELNKLHVRLRLHGDLKPDNFILDEASNKLRLIDFATVQKVSSVKDFAATSMYVDMKEGKPRKTASDMFAMGYIVAVLFPELFDLAVSGMRFMLYTPDGGMQMLMQAEPPYRVKKKNKDSLSNSDTAVIALLDACMEENAEDRCTSQQALLFCNNLAAMLSIKPDIDAKELESVLTSSINRNVYEVEDALRGSKRPAKFGAVKAVKPEPKPKPVVAATLYAPKKDVPAKTTNDNDNHKCVLM